MPVVASAVGADAAGAAAADARHEPAAARAVAAGA
jgi:hypothetical protein